MPYAIVTRGAQEAIEDILTADTALTALLASKPSARGGGPAIYDDGDVFQGQTFPYLTIGAWTQVPSHTLSPDGDGYGWNCTCQIKAVGQRLLVLEQVMSLVAGLLEPSTSLDLSGYPSAWVDEMNVQPSLKEILAGVTTFQLPVILRVYVS
jgi:hypothetical protein